ncbi:hypothetical protein [Streptomyces sediminimaris]|uniref:hypothetical protein n=1 Tax=Streptomyces sediminimaris TaxID=3383721 RepID=UPI00399964A6
MAIARRIGSSPTARGCQTGQTCPAIFELTDGNFAIIGTDATAELDPELPAGAGRANCERIVIINREVLIQAKEDIPDA